MASLGAHWLASRVKSSAVREDVDGTLLTDYLRKPSRTRWMTWPHLEPHRHSPRNKDHTMKKSQGPRSHSWWWDSHICPKNSKWLSENLSEMDSKLNAMLHIIEEDADSFAERAEMYYRRRPELINLVEEFYRIYRSLVERYNFLTREIRQNLAPALQDQLGISGDSVGNSSIDLQMKKGPEGFDVISLSRSFTEDSEFDDEDQSEVSSKKWKMSIEEEETVSADFGVNNDARFAGSIRSNPVLEEEDGSALVEETRPNNATQLDMQRLEEELQHLKEENEALTFKASEEITTLKNTQLELLSMIKKLEADDKVAKSRLQAALEKSVKLDAENLKLSHALILLKEEKREIIELHKKDMEFYKAAIYNVDDLQKQLSFLKEESLKAHLEASSRAQQVQKLSEERQELLHALSKLQEEVTVQEKAVQNQEIFEDRLKEFQEQVSSLYQKNSTLKEQMAHEVEHVKTLDIQLADLQKNRIDLERELCRLQEQNQILERERFESAPTILKLQHELQTAKKEFQSLKDEFELKMQQTVKLEEDIERFKGRLEDLLNQQIEGNGRLRKLESQIQELQAERAKLVDKCEIHIGSCKDFELMISDLKEQLASKTCENAILKEKVLASEVASKKTESKVEDLQQIVYNLDKEKELMFQELEKAKADNEQHFHEVQEILEKFVLTENKMKDLHAQLDYLRECKLNLEKNLLDSTMTCNELKENFSIIQGEKDQLSNHLSFQACMVVWMEEENIALDEENREMLSKSKLVGDKLQKLEADMINLQRLLKLSQEEKTVALESVKRITAYKSFLEDKWTGTQKELLFLQNEKSLLQLNILEGITRMKKLEEDNAQLYQSKSVLEADISFQVKQVSILQEETIKLQVGKNKLELNLQNVLKKMDLLEKENDGLQHSVTNLQQENKNMEHAIFKAAEDNKETDGALLDASKEFTSLKTENEELKAEVATAVEVIEMIKKGLTEIQEARRTLENEILFGVTNVNALQQQEVNRLKRENKGLHLQTDSESENLERKDTQIEKVSGSIADIEKEKKLVLEDLHELKEVLAELHEERETLKSEILSGLTNIHALQEELSGLKNDKENLHLQISSGSKQLERKELQTQKLFAHIADAENEKKLMLEDIRKLREGLAELLEEKITLENEVLCGISNMDALKLEVSGLKNENKDLHLQISSGSEQLEIKDVEIQKLFGHMDALKQEVIGLKNENGNLCLQIRSGSKQLVKKDMEMQKLLGHIMDLDTENKLVLEKLQNFKKAVAGLHEEKRTLEKETLSRLANTDALQQEVSVLKSENDNLHLQICSGSKQLERQELEIQKLLGHIMDVESEKMSVLEDLQNLKKALAELHEEKRILEAEMLSGLANMDALLQEVSALKSENENLHLQICSGSKQLERNEMEIQKLLGRIMDVDSEKKSALEDLQKLQEAHIELHGTLDNEIQHGIANMDALQEEVKRLKNESKSLHLHINSISQQLERKDMEIQKLLGHIKDVESEKNLVLEDLKKLKEAHTQLHEERKILEMRILSGLANIDALQQEVNGLKNENKDLHLEVSTGSKQLDIKDMQIKELSAHIADVQLETKLVLEDLQNVKEALTQHDEERRTRENQILSGVGNINVLQQEVEGLKNENKHLHLQVSSGPKQLELKEMQIQELSGHIVGIQSEKGLVQLELQKLKEEISKLHKEIITPENKIISSISNLDSLQEEIYRLKNENEDLHLQISSGSEQLERKDMQIQKLSTHAVNLESEKKTMLEDVQKLKEALAELHEERKTLEKKIVSGYLSMNTMQVEASRLKNESQDLHLQITSSSEQLAKKVVEIEKKSGHILKVESEKKCLLDSLQKLRHDNAFVEIKLKELQEKYTDLHLDYIRNKDELSHHINHGKSLEAELKNLQIERATLLDGTSMDKKQLTKLQEEVAELQEREKKLLLNFEEKESKEDKLVKEIGRLQQCLLLLDQENAVMGTKVMKISHDYNLAISDLQDQLCHLQGEKMELIRQMVTGVSMATKLQEALSSSEKQNTDLSNRASSLEQSTAKLLKKVDFLRDENGELYEKFEAGKAEFLRIENLEDLEILRLKEALTLLEADHKTLKEDYHRQGEEKCLLENRVRDIMNEISNMLDENSVYKAHVESHSYMLMRLDDALSTANIEVSGLTEKVKLQESQADELQELLVKEQEMNEELRRILRGEEIDKLTAEDLMAKFKEELLQLQHQIELVLERTCRLEDEKVTLEEQGSRLNDKRLSQEEEIRDLHNLLISFHEEAKMLGGLLARNLLMMQEEIKAVTKECQKTIGRHVKDFKDWTDFLEQEDPSGNHPLGMKSLINSYDCTASPKNHLDGERQHTNHMRSFHGEMQALKEKKTYWASQLQIQIEEVEILRKAVRYLLYVFLKTKTSDGSLIRKTDEVQEADSLSKVHISLSIRLRQEEISDKLQQQACEVKKSHTKLVKRLKKLEMEVQRLQSVVEGGDEKECIEGSGRQYDEEMDAVREMLVRIVDYVKKEEDNWKIVEEQVLMWASEEGALMKEEKAIKVGEEVERIVEENKKHEMEVEEVHRRLQALKTKREERSELQRQREREKEEDASSLVQKWIFKPIFPWLVFKSPSKKGQSSKLKLTGQENTLLVQQIKTKSGMNCWACIRTPAVTND